MATKLFNMSISGVEGLKAAIARNPRITSLEIRKFLVRSTAVYKTGIIRSPWKIGGSGGGAPVDTGNLRDTHATKIGAVQATITPTADYAKYVHGRNKGEINARTGVKSRPWLDYVFEDKDNEIRRLQDDLLKTIVRDLAK